MPTESEDWPKVGQIHRMFQIVACDSDGNPYRANLHGPEQPFIDWERFAEAIDNSLNSIRTGELPKGTKLKVLTRVVSDATFLEQVWSPDDSSP